MTAAPGFAETHSAVVWFLGDRAYKVKKPVDLGFLDFRTREAREAVCHREVELNRRLAPDVYLGVADVIGPDGQTCDHLVVMRRMPDDRRLSTLLAAGEPVEDHLWHIAHRLATIRDSAKIMVLNGGEIVEYASHDELMAAKGFYYALYMSQFKGKAPAGAAAADVDFVST